MTKLRGRVLGSGIGKRYYKDIIDQVLTDRSGGETYPQSFYGY